MTAKSASDAATLTREQKDQVERHSSPRAVIIHEIIRKDGELEITRTVSALTLSGLAAGLSMGFSFLTQALLTASLPDTIWRHSLASFGYSLGFIFVVLGRQQLFTESTLTAVLPLLTRRDLRTLYLTARLWFIVLLVNLVGTWIFASMLQVRSLFSPEATLALQSLAQASVGHLFWSTLMKGILAGWLIALMVWILPSTQSARLLTILIITYVVALAQLPHIVAGSSEAAYAVLAGLIPLSDYFFYFLVPTLVGNTIGGVALVSMLNHGSIAPEIGKG